MWLLSYHTDAKAYLVYEQANYQRNTFLHS